MSSYVRDLVRFRSRRTPHREAVCEWESGRRFTWKDLELRADRLACFLVDILGIEKGDRIGFLSTNSIFMLDMYYASFDTGVVIDVLNHKLMADELVAMVQNERPKALFFSSSCRDKARVLRDSLNGNCVLVLVDDANDEAADYSAADIENAAIHPLRPVELSFDDPQMLIHTGGTTGLPKAAILSVRSLFMNAVVGVVSLGYTADDVACAGMPLCHTAGWNVTLLPVLLAGGRVVFTEGFSPDSFLDIVEQERPTVFLAADAMYRAISSHPRFSETDLSSFKWVMGGGGPISLCSMEPFWEKGVKFFTGYGMTETGPNNVAPELSVALEENMAKPFSVGKPLACTEVRIVDESGHDVEQGVRGQVLMRGPLSFSGYWGHETGSDAVLEGGWIETGDIGVIDEDGDLLLCGRMKNMYISGGENVFPIEAERCLESHPSIREACVFGVPDDRWGEVGKALLVAEPGARVERAEIERFLARSLSTIKHPRFLEFVESIPKNSAGKRDEKQIRGLYG